MKILTRSIFTMGIMLIAALPVYATGPITFDEVAINTLISDQYEDMGVIFAPGDETGRLPQTSMNGAMPDQPILRPTGEPDYSAYEGDFWMQFPHPASSVQFDSGYWDSAGVGVIDVYSPGGTLLVSLSNPGTGVQLISIFGYGPIGSIYFSSIGDGGGADIDNLSFELVTTPVPTMTAWGMMILVLLFGFISIYFIRKRKAEF